MSVAAASPFRYSHTVGMQIQQGRGFHNPMDLAIGKDGVWYVINRSNAMWAPNSLRIGMCTVDEEFLGDFGYFGEGDGQFVWPIGIAIDSKGRVYVSDEHRHDVQVFESDGTYVAKWGSFGDGPGQFNRPSSMAIDEQDRVFVVDGMNHRVQILTTDGRVPGQLRLRRQRRPASSACRGASASARPTTSTWRTGRTTASRRLTRDGRHLGTVGSPGTEDGQLKRPAGVGVDRNGYVFVADWGNERVQVFAPDGKHFTTLIGDATLSTWAKDLLADRARISWSSGHWSRT